MNQPLLTHEVGSLSKPGWRVKPVAGRALDEVDIDDARLWGQRLEVAGYEGLLELLRRAPLESDEKRWLKRWSSHYGTRLFESAGLDVVYDGEQQRSEMYAWAVAHANGFDFRGSVRSFDNKYYSKAAVTGPISLESPYHNDEFDFVASLAKAELKIPVTGAYTIAAWSFDEYYRPTSNLGLSVEARKTARRVGRQRFVVDVARDLIRPNLQALIDLGARWIQIDEPAGSTAPDELDIVVEAFNVSVEGLDAMFSTHLCFSDYDLFFPAIEDMTGCRQYAVGFANYDSRELGVSDEARPGYAIIKKFRDLSYKPALGLGVLDVHTDFVEPPELIRDRIVYATGVFGDPHRIHVCPDCGLRTRSWEVVYDKLRNMVIGTEMAKEQLGL